MVQYEIPATVEVLRFSLLFQTRADLNDNKEPLPLLGFRGFLFAPISWMRSRQVQSSIKMCIKLNHIFSLLRTLWI